MAIIIIIFIATIIRKHLLPAAMHMVLYSVWFYTTPSSWPSPIRGHEVQVSYWNSQIWVQVQTTSLNSWVSWSKTFFLLWAMTHLKIRQMNYIIFKILSHVTSGLLPESAAVIFKWEKDRQRELTQNLKQVATSRDGVSELSMLNVVSFPGLTLVSLCSQCLLPQYSTLCFWPWLSSHFLQLLARWQPILGPQPLFFYFSQPHRGVRSQLDH